MNDEKVFAVMTKLGNLYGPITRRDASKFADPEDPDGFGDDVVILRLIPSGCTGSNIEDETREGGYWPPK